MCACIYCFLYCLYCVFVLFCLCIFILICFVCTSVRTAATEWQLNCSSSSSSSSNNNKPTTLSPNHLLLKEKSRRMTCVGRHVYLGINSASEGRRATVSLPHVLGVNGALCTDTILGRAAMAF